MQLKKKRILSYKFFESIPNDLTEEQLGWMKICTRGKWEVDPFTGHVNINGGFNCENQELSDFKGIRFGEIKGFFYCSHNKLTSLEGSPLVVKGSFFCSYNRLTSLYGSPEIVSGHFYCSQNSIVSLNGAPNKLGLNFFCKGNPVSESTLGGIFKIMQTGKSYQDALGDYWASMDLDDRILMYKDKKGLSPEEIKKYGALARYNNMKGLI